MDTTASNTLLARNEIPVIDLAYKGSSGKKTITKKLDEALSTNGFVFLTNHGISEKSIQSVYTIMEKFCALPDDVKEDYIMHPPEEVQGYIPAGKEILTSGGTKEMKHCYNIVSTSEKLPTKEIENFQNVIAEVTQGFLKLSKFLLNTVAEALDLDPEWFFSLHKGMLTEKNLTTFRILYYPPLEEEPSSNITRCGEHTDWGIFTLLTQDVDGGLELFRDGEWRRIGHLPGAILMNVGDILDLWTSSKYKSVKHRVVVPEDSKIRNKGRHSTAFFVNPDNETLVDPSMLRGYQKHSNESKVNKITALDYVHQRQIKALEV